MVDERVQIVAFTELERYFEAIYDKVARGERHGCGYAKDRLLELVIPADEIADLSATGGLSAAEEFRQMYARRD